MLTEIKRKMGHVTPWQVPRQRLPDEMKCRGRQIAKSDMVACMAGANHPCEFSVELGCSLFCFHPRRLEIAARANVDRRGKNPKSRS